MLRHTALAVIFVSIQTTAIAAEPLPLVSSVTTDDMIPQIVQSIWTNSDEACDSEGEDVSNMVNGLRISFADDPKDSAIYILLCGGPATYNKPFVLFAHDTTRNFARPLALPIMTDTGPSVQREIYNIKWDNSRRQLSAFGKDRGLADCGMKYIWKLPFDSVNAEFVLVEQRSKTDCDGHLDNFPVVWPFHK